MSAFGSWRRSRSVLITATLVLAVASGAAITVWSALQAYILRPLPFPDLNRLVTIWEVDPALPDILRQVTSGNFSDWLASQSSFEKLTGGINRSYTLTSFEDGGTPLMREIGFEYFETLGVQPQLGRTFSREETQEGGPPVVMISHDLWTQRFSASPGVIGLTTGMDGVPHTIVGVLPKGHTNPAYLLDVVPQAYLPMQLRGPDRELRRAGRGGVVVFGRLKEGVTIAKAQAEMDRLMAVSRQEHRDALGPTTALVTPAAEGFVRPIRPALYALTGGVLLLVLVACGNVANLLLFRAVGRRQEMGIRRALGARPRDLLVQGLNESLVPGVLGAVGGLALAWAGVRAAAAVIPVSPGLPRPDLGLDQWAVLFSMGVALFTTFLCGLFPALAATRVDAATELGSSGKGIGEGGAQSSLRELLLVAEVAMALTLFIGGAMAYTSLQNLEALKKGFDTSNALTFRVSTRGADYQEGPARAEFFRRILDEFRAIPGVESAGSSLAQPFAAGGGYQAFTMAGREPPPEGREPQALLRPTQPGYFDAFGTPFISGRDIRDDDTAESEPVAVVNEAFAERNLAGRAPLDSAIITRDGKTRRIVGVVTNVRGNGRSPLPVPAIFVPLRQDSTPTAMAFMVRTRGDLKDLLPQVEAGVRRVDPSLPVYFVQSLETFVQSLDAPARFLSALLVAFAVLAVALSLVGTYAVLSYATSQRRREFGLRVALGASPANIAGLILRRASGVTALGVAFGLVGALAAGRFIQGLLFEVNPFDPALYAVGVVSVCALMLLAALSPAMRAASVNAAATLKEG